MQPQPRSVVEIEEDPSKELREILSRQRPIEKFAIDDYEACIVFAKETRQALSRLFYKTPKDNPASKVIMESIKRILQLCGKESLLAWYHSDFSEHEIYKYALKLLKEKYQYQE